jgi:hypothetical protein
MNPRNYTANPKGWHCNHLSEPFGQTKNPGSVREPRPRIDLQALLQPLKQLTDLDLTRVVALVVTTQGKERDSDRSPFLQRAFAKRATGLPDRERLPGPWDSQSILSHLVRIDVASEVK